jgi:O-antigen ligase
VVLLAAASDKAFDLLGRDGTLTGRSDIWRLAIEVRSSSFSQWVGRGLDFWSPSNPDAVLIWRAVKWTPFSSHNSYLDWWLMLGTIGALLILAWVSSVLIRSAAVSMRQRRLICLFPLALCVSISSFTEQYLVSPIGLMLLALVSAASIGALSRTHDSV